MTFGADLWQPGSFSDTHPYPGRLAIIVKFYVPRSLRRDASMRQPFVMRLCDHTKFGFHVSGLSLPRALGRRERILTRLGKYLTPTERLRSLSRPTRICGPVAHSDEENNPKPQSYF